MPTIKKTHNLLFTHGKPRYILEPDWKLHIIISSDNIALGIYGWDMRDDAVIQQSKILAHNPNARVSIVERTYKFDKRPSVGDKLTP